MLAEKNPIFETTTVIVREVSEEERLRQIYEAREDQLRQQMDFHKYYNNLINEQAKQLESQAAQLSDKDAQLESQATQLADKDARIAELERLLAEKK